MIRKMLSGAIIGLMLLASVNPAEAKKNLLQSLFKIYQTYEQVNMMMWLAGDSKAEKRFGEEVKWFINLTNKKNKNPEANQRVRSIFERLKPQFRDRGFDYNLTLLQGDTVNAFAIPGGSVFVYQGMIDMVGSDDELAAVLAHELTHSEKRHSLKQLRQNAAFTLLLQAAVKNKRDQQTWGAVVGALTSMAFSREHEQESDAIGQAKMYAAGFDPAAQVLLWERFVQRFGKGEKGPMAWLSTHPPSSDRVNSARNRLPQFAPRAVPLVSGSPGFPGAPVGPAASMVPNAGVPTAVLVETQENALKNGGFETDSTKRGFPDAWEKRDGTAALDTTQAFTGSVSLAMTTQSVMKPTRVVSDFVGINPSSAFDLTGYVRSEDGKQKISIGAELYNKAKRLRGFIWPVINIII